jgi:exopolyphosphatase / guanosine-5'-triphosphate,3'-diphosphate pyrophosphatase
MKYMRLGVVDLGTNTFHLLIVDVLKDKSFKEVYRKRLFIHLAEDGIETIGEAPYKRGIEALNDFALKMIQYRVDKFKVKGTAALRTATNGAQFLAEVKAKTNISIETITGDEEAKLIYYGVREAVDLPPEPSLMIDVGGGSVEFIIANQERMFWAQSFPIGIAVLHKGFHHSEPIAPNEIQRLQNYLKTTLTPLKEELSKYTITTLIGASGTFDVLTKSIRIKKEDKHAAYIEFEDFIPLYNKVVSANYESRLQMSEIPQERKKLIVVAFVLIKYVLDTFNLSEAIISHFAMKEGMIRELVDES